MTLDNTVMNLTFSDPRAADCGRSSTGSNESATIHIRGTANDITCLDLDYIFTHPNETAAIQTNPTLSSSWTNYLRYSLDSDTAGWSPDTFNYSQVFYTQRRARNQEQDDSLFGNVAFRAFAEPGCPYNAYNSSDGNWYTWDCASESGVCSTLPFSVRSILIGGLDVPQDAGTKGCANAQVNAAGGKLHGSVGSILTILVGLAMYLGM